MAVNKIKAPLFDLDTTLDSGQVFGWKKVGDWRYGEIAKKPVRVRQEGSHLYFEGTTKKHIIDYFALDEDVAKIYKRISKKDSILTKAVKEFNGLRLMRQDPWICTVSFVCSAFSNIPRIEKKLENLRKKYGKPVTLNGRKMNLFPTANALASASIKGLRGCGLGFRDKYVRELGRRMKKFNIVKLKGKSHVVAKAALMESAGIGEKVADCISLFSLDNHEAFPIDVWIARIMKRLYGKEIKKSFPKTKLALKDIQAFAKEKWGRDAGYAQQFLYMYGRKHLKKGTE